MREYYHQQDIDLLDAHSFLWTLNQDVLGTSKSQTMSVEAATAKEKSVDVGAIVIHKDYGKGTIINITDKNIYVDFDGKKRIFPSLEAFEKEYLKLVQLFGENVRIRGTAASTAEQADDYSLTQNVHNFIIEIDFDQMTIP